MFRATHRPYKYGIIKLRYIVASCCIFLYELYYDARIHKHHKIKLGFSKNIILVSCSETWCLEQHTVARYTTAF